MLNLIGQSSLQPIEIPDIIVITIRIAWLLLDEVLVTMKCNAMAKKLAVIFLMTLIFNQTSALIIPSAIVGAISSMGFLGSKIYCQ